MGNERKLRLIQVAKEFNVGLNTITDFLQKKGIKSDGSPNTLVDADTYAVLEKEFGANRSAAGARDSIRERISLKQTTITLEEALKLFELPRNLGEYEGEVISVSTGRFGPYIRHNNKYVSLPKEYTPQTVTFDEAVALIEKKREEEKNRIIKTFPENSDLELLNGRFGPYIAYKGKNFKIPKGNKPEELSNDDCMKIIESDSKPKAKRAPRKK